MAERFHDYAGSYTLHKKQAGARMPKIMEANIRQASPFQKRFKTAAIEVLAI